MSTVNSTCPTTDVDAWTGLITTESEWYGYMTVHNYRQIARRVSQMLTGKRYTYVSMSYVYTRDGALPAHLDVRAGQKLSDPSWVNGSKDVVALCDHDPASTSNLVGFMFSDTYGLHHYSTDKQDQSHVDMDDITIAPGGANYHEAYWAVYVTFKGKREIRVVQRVADGNRLEVVYSIDQGY